MSVASCIMQVGRITIAGKAGIDSKGLQDSIRKRFSSAGFAELEEMALSVSFRGSPNIETSESMSSGASISGYESLNSSRTNKENTSSAPKQALKKKNENLTPKNNPRVAQKKAKDGPSKKKKKEKRKKVVFGDTRNIPSNSDSESDDETGLDMILRRDDSTDRSIGETCRRPSDSCSD